VWFCNRRQKEKRINPPSSYSSSAMQMVAGQALLTSLPVSPITTNVITTSSSIGSSSSVSTPIVHTPTTMIHTNKVTADSKQFASAAAALVSAAAGSIPIVSLATGHPMLGPLAVATGGTNSALVIPAGSSDKDGVAHQQQLTSAAQVLASVVKATSVQNETIATSNTDT